MPTTLSAPLQEELQLLLIEYLHKGTHPIRFRESLANFRDANKPTQALSGQELFEMIDVDINSRFTKAILGNLLMSDSEQKAYITQLSAAKKSVTSPAAAGDIETGTAAPKTSVNLYELLNDLYHRDPIKHYRLRRLLVEMQRLSRPTKWWLFAMIGAAVSGMLGAMFYYRREYADAIETWARNTIPTVTDWLARTFSLLRNMPILGIIYQLTTLSLFWIASFVTSTHSSEPKLSRLFFRTMAAGFSIAAYTLVYLAAGVTTPLAAGFFIASPAVGLLKSIYAIFSTRSDFKPQETLDKKFETLSENAVIENLYYRNWQIFFVQFLSALLTTAAAAVMTIFPAGLVIFITCMAFMIFVEQARSLLITQIHESYDAALQETIHSLHDATQNPEHVLKRDERLNPLSSDVYETVTKERKETQVLGLGGVLQRIIIKTKKDKLDTEQEALLATKAALVVRTAELDRLRKEFEVQVAQQEKTKQEQHESSFYSGFSKGLQQGLKETQQHMFLAPPKNDQMTQTPSHSAKNGDAVNDDTAADLVAGVK